MALLTFLCKRHASMARSCLHNAFTQIVSMWLQFKWTNRLSPCLYLTLKDMQNSKLKCHYIENLFHNW